MNIYVRISLGSVFMVGMLVLWYLFVMMPCPVVPGPVRPMCLIVAVGIALAGLISGLLGVWVFFGDFTEKQEV